MHIMRQPRITSIALLAAVLLTCGCTTPTEPSRSLSHSKQTPHVLLLTGLDARDLDSFSNLDPDRRQTTLRVRVADAPADAPSLSGELTRDYFLRFGAP